MMFWNSFVMRLGIFGLICSIATSGLNCQHLSGDDAYYADPNKFAQNDRVQDALRKYADSRGYDRNGDDLLAVMREMEKLRERDRYTQQNKYDRQNRYPDQRYQDGRYPNQGYQNERYPDQKYPQDQRGYVDYSTQQQPSGGSPRQYFENDPRLAVQQEEIFKILAEIDTASSQQCSINVKAQWDFETNVNEVSQIRALEQQLAYSDFQRRVHDIIEKIDPWDVRNRETLRQLRYIGIVGPAVLPPDQLNRYNRLINDMLAIYNTASICAHEEPLQCGLRLDPSLNLIMARSRDWDELQHTWIEWHRRSGQKIRDLYVQLIELSNHAARLNNFTDTSQYWTYAFESYEFKRDMEIVWEQIRPLYEQLHAYVRRKLRDLYGPEKISREAPLPAHILGNMWGQSWENIMDVTVPYPGKNFLDVTPEMIRQGYTPEAMFRVAEEFFISMNMSAMPPDFWTKSVLEEFPGRPIICQPSAWDFCNSFDYRIKMCTRVTMKDFITAHHEMAHIHYFMKYRHLPKVYRDGANPGFHEAVSEAISLSVSNPKHMQTLGLVLTNVDDLPHNINFLFNLAMDKLTFLPFSLALDKWRWDIFSGHVGKERYNCHWWDLRERFSGVKPPVLRSESDFDPGSKYHVPANIPYIGYYFGTILEFQIFKSMCKAAGQYVEGDRRKPLHKCDIYRSKEAGAILNRIMESGSSVPWQELLRTTIGETRLNAEALREYFRPLEEWLRNENLRTGEFIGWVYDGDYCKQSIETANLQVAGGFYNAAPSSNPSLAFITTLAAAITFIFLSSALNF